MLLFCSLDCCFVLLGGVTCLFIVLLDLLHLILFVNSVGDCSFVIIFASFCVFIWLFNLFILWFCCCIEFLF